MTEAFYITPETRDQYIAEALSFCDNVTALFVRQAHLERWADDLRGVARLKLVEVVNKIAESGKPLSNKTHFFAKLRISVRRRLIDASEENRIIKTPRTRGATPRFPHPQIIRGNHHDVSFYLLRVGTRRRGVNPACDSTSNLEFRRETAFPQLKVNATREDLFDRCRDGIDRSLLTQALNGRTRKEIANDLGIPQRDVRQRANRILKAGPIE